MGSRIVAARFVKPLPVKAGVEVREKVSERLLDYCVVVRVVIVWERGNVARGPLHVLFARHGL
jgi:hypothetical protein